MLHLILGICFLDYILEHLGVILEMIGADRQVRAKALRLYFNAEFLVGAFLARPRAVAPGPNERAPIDACDAGEKNLPRLP